MPPQKLQTSASKLSSTSLGLRRNSFFFIVVLVWAIVYLGRLFQPPLLDDADTVHAEAAREMALDGDGDWITLHINGGDGARGFRYLEKAPLMYWCTAVSFKLFGVSEWSARLPIALGVLALLLMT